MHHDLEFMSHETDRLQRLLDDLFLLARVEVGKLEFDTAPIDAKTLIPKVVQTVAPLAWERGRVRVVAKVSSDLPKVWADAGRLEQILQNLLQNGIRHTPPGGIVAVTATAEADTGMVKLEVHDTGAGIEPDELLHIWERFYHSTQTGNTGIGLTLVKELTTAMGGTVAVESTRHQGSSFIIRLRSDGG
jgi:signal transduction histidine kinase